MSPGVAGKVLRIEVQKEYKNLGRKLDSCTRRSANALRNSALTVLNNASPSAPGSPPGVRTGHLRRDWVMYYSAGGSSGVFGIISGAYYAGYLEKGTSKMAARPYMDRIKEKALPKINAIFHELGG